MMKKNLLKAVITVCCLVAFASAHAEVPISASGQIGYSSPQGSYFKNDVGEKMSKFGIGLDFDILWHFEQLDYKLGVGLTWNTAFLFGADVGNFDIGLYGLNLYGVKGQWRFLDSKVSPYGALAFGLSRFSTPQISMIDSYGNETIIDKGENKFNLGIRPEIGVDLGGFLISMGYFVPMNYSLNNKVSKTAGNLQINIGYRHTFY